MPSRPDPLPAVESRGGQRALLPLRRLPVERGRLREQLPAPLQHARERRRAAREDAHAPGERGLRAEHQPADARGGERDVRRDADARVRQPGVRHDAAARLPARDARGLRDDPSEGRRQSHDVGPLGHVHAGRVAHEPAQHGTRLAQPERQHALPVRSERLLRRAEQRQQDGQRVPAPQHHGRLGDDGALSAARRRAAGDVVGRAVLRPRDDAAHGHVAELPGPRTRDAERGRGHDVG